MIPFLVLLAVTALSAVIGLLVERRAGGPRSGWQRPLAHGLAAMFLVAASAHFLEPLRSGLIATVPPIVPFPDLVVTATGILEVGFAAALLAPVSRRLTAAAVVLYLFAVFPANVIAGTAVEQDGLTTPLPFRAAIQLVFIGAAVVVARTGTGPGVRDLLRKLGKSPQVVMRRNPKHS